MGDFKGVRFADRIEDIVRFIGEYKRVMHHWQQDLHIDMLDVTDKNARAKLLEYIGLPWNDTIMAEERWRQVKVIKTCSYCQTRSPLYSSSVGRWRNYRAYLGDHFNMLTDGDSKNRAAS